MRGIVYRYRIENSMFYAADYLRRSRLVVEDEDISYSLWLDRFIPGLNDVWAYEMRSYPPLHRLFWLPEFLPMEKEKGSYKIPENFVSVLMSQSNIIMYTTEDGITKVEVTFEQDTVWLSIDQMSELFQRDKSVIGKHIRNIFKEGELVKEAVWAKFAYTASDGKTYQVDFYNLDVIISVGYRVKSLRGTQFRIWASNILKEYMKKGFALDDERLKNLGGGNYFDELLLRIWDIRSSEKVFWRKVLEIYATSIDYETLARIGSRSRRTSKVHSA